MKLLLAIAAGLVGYCYYLGRNAPRSRTGTREEITRWEGEGGNVPSVATPAPNPVPISSFPEDPRVRH